MMMKKTVKNIHSLFYKDDKGVAAIEGAMLLPVAILMFIGIFEVGQALLLNQKIYSASHMTADLLTRKSSLTRDDLDDAYAAAQLIIEPFDSNSLGLDIVGVRFDHSASPEELWSQNYNSSHDADLYLRGEGLGNPGEGVIIVKASYVYTPTFLNLNLPGFSTENIFRILDMEETTILRGRVNACLSYDNGGTQYTC